MHQLTERILFLFNRANERAESNAGLRVGWRKILAQNITKGSKSKLSIELKITGQPSKMSAKHVAPREPSLKILEITDDSDKEERQAAILSPVKLGKRVTTNVRNSIYIL